MRMHEAIELLRRFPQNSVLCAGSSIEVFAPLSGGETSTEWKFFPIDVADSELPWLPTSEPEQVEA